MKMIEGSYIYDKSELSLHQRVSKAAKEHQEKTGVVPNLALVDPKHLEGDKERVIICDNNKITVMGDHGVPDKITFIGIGRE